jgi:hypothetical protein
MAIDCFREVLKMGNIISITFVGIAITLWMVLMFLLVRAVWFSVRSRSWPTTTGKVKQSSVEEVGKQYRESFQYEYTVDGSNYVSNVISFLDLFLLVFMNGTRSRRAAKHVVDRYPTGSEVTVYYDRKNPKRAVLETNVWNINVIIIALALIIMGGVFFLGFWAV